MRVVAVAALAVAGCAGAGAMGNRQPPAEVRAIAHAEALEEVWRARADPLPHRPRYGIEGRVPMRRHARPYVQPGRPPVVSDSGLVLYREGDALVARSVFAGAEQWRYSPLPAGELQIGAQDGVVLAYCGSEGILLGEADGRRIGDPIGLPAGRILRAAHHRWYLHDDHEIAAWDTRARRKVWEWKIARPLIPVAPWDSGTRILGVDFAPDRVVVEVYYGGRGYPLTVVLDVVTAQPVWDTLARWVDAAGDVAACVRETEEMLDVRGLDDGRWRSEHPVRGYDGRGLWLDGGDVLFVARTRWFGEESVAVGAEGVRPAAAPAREGFALIRYDPQARSVEWAEPVASCALEFDRFGRVIVEVSREMEPAPRLLEPTARAPVAKELRGICARTGATLWRVRIGEGAAGWAVWGRHVLVLARTGELICFRRVD